MYDKEVFSKIMELLLGSLVDCTMGKLGNHDVKYDILNKD